MSDYTPEKLTEALALLRTAQPAQGRPHIPVPRVRHPRQEYLAKLSVAAREGKVLLELDGVKQSRAQWARQFGMSPDVLRKRLQRGADLRTALSEPAPARNFRTHSVAEIMAFVRLQKAKPCTDCGNRFHPEAMEFDHCRGRKKFNLSSANDHHMDAVISELAKCDLVCANCHRIRTASRRPLSPP